MEQNKLTQEIELTLKRMSGDCAAELSDEAHTLLELHLKQLLEAKREEIKEEELVRAPYTTKLFVEKSTLEGLERLPYTSAHTVAEAMLKSQQPSKVIAENEVSTEVTQAELLAGGWFCRDFSLQAFELLKDFGIPHLEPKGVGLHLLTVDEPVFSMAKGIGEFKCSKLISVDLRCNYYKEIVCINNKFYWVK